MTLIPPGLLEDLRTVLDLAAEGLHYRNLLEQAAALPRSPVYYCRDCGKLGIRERANQRLCEECKR